MILKFLQRLVTAFFGQNYEQVSFNNIKPEILHRKTPVKDSNNMNQISERPSCRSSLHSLGSGKNKFELDFRRKSCCCSWCGGLARFEERTQDINIFIKPHGIAGDVSIVQSDLEKRTFSTQSNLRAALRSTDHFH